MSMKYLSRIGFFAALAFATFAALPYDAQAQVSSGKVTTAAPTYTNNTAQPLSLDTSGNLRVAGSFTPPALQNVNLTQVGSTTVSNTTPGLLDVNCLSGCAGAGNSLAQATTAAPSYVNGTSNPLSMDLSGNLRVLVGNASIPVTQSGTWNIGTVTAVTTITNAVTVVGNVASGAADSGNPVKIGAIYNTSAPAPSNGQRVDLQAGTSGELLAVPRTTTAAQSDGATNTPTLALGFSTAGVAQSGIASRTYAYLFNGSTWDRVRSGGVTGMAGVNPQATSSGGTTPFHLIAANSNNSTLIGSAGTHVVYAMQLTNNSATIAYAKLYDKATAPTCGTDTPIATLIIPASTAGSGSNVDFGATGLSVTLGLGLCVVTGLADNDNTSVAASTYAINIGYK